MGRSMDWTRKDNVVSGLFFCATLTSGVGRFGSFTPAYTNGYDPSVACERGAEEQAA